jgi:HEPN domain-containing protein
MFADDVRKIEVLRQWVQKAENDLINATHSLKLGKRCPTDTVGFHAQQCVEKYLKALLVNHAVDFPKTHNIARLLELTPLRVRPKLSQAEQLQLTDYATVTRYPGDYQIPTLTDARAAVRIARRVRSHVRKHLPKEALKGN